MEEEQNLKPEKNTSENEDDLKSSDTLIEK